MSSVAIVVPLERIKTITYLKANVLASHKSVLLTNIILTISECKRAVKCSKTRLYTFGYLQVQALRLSIPVFNKGYID